jgi:hypothetical protein
VTRTLLKNGADPYLGYADGSYVLQAIVEEHSLLEPFLELESLDIEKRSSHGRTLLLSACILTRKPHPYISSVNDEAEKNYPVTANNDAILALLHHGALPTATDDQGRTPLHWLVSNSYSYFLPILTMPWLLDRTRELAL